VEDAKSARAKSAADRKQLHITKIGERITNLLPADLRASQPTSSLLYRHLAASLLSAPSSARTAQYAAIAEPLGRAWNAVANAGLLVSVQDERSLARTFLLCCARAGSSVSALRRGQPGMLLAIVRSAWPTCCSRAAGMPLVPIDRATAEPAVFIDALFHAPIVARIRASVPSRHMGVLLPSGWPKYFEQLCADAAQASGIVTSNSHISQQLWRLRISRPDRTQPVPFKLRVGLDKRAPLGRQPAERRVLGPSALDRDVLSHTTLQRMHELGETPICLGHRRRSLGSAGKRPCEAVDELFIPRCRMVVTVPVSCTIVSGHKRWIGGGSGG